MDAFELAEAYALDPTPEGLSALRGAIMKDPGYDPLVLIGGTLNPLMREARYQDVVETVRSWMPGVLLSPSAHGYLAGALSALGETEGSRAESKFSRLSLDSIAATGSGSPDDPCSVLRIEDEYDILRASSQHSVSQRNLSDERGQFDAHTVEDGTEIWFRLLWFASPGDESSTREG